MLVELATQPRDAADVHLCNAYTLALADKDPVLQALLRALLNFPDGKSVVWANQLLHRDQQVPSNRVYGPDLFLDVFAAGQDVGLRHYLLGSTPQSWRRSRPNWTPVPAGGDRRRSLTTLPRAQSEERPASPGDPGGRRPDRLAGPRNPQTGRRGRAARR